MLYLAEHGPGISDQETRDAEREFDTATTRTALSASAKKQMLGKQELKRLEGAWTGPAG